MINVVKNKNIFLSISLALVVASIISVSVFGLTPGVDFSGGTLWEVRFENSDISASEIRAFFGETYALRAIVRKSEDSVSIRTPVISQTDRQEYREAIEEEFGPLEEVSVLTIGPSIGAKLRQNAIFATIAVLLGISFYVAFAFRKASRVISSWKYGTTTLVTLFHDVLIPVGIFSFLGAYQGIEIDTNFVVALLVIAGFSVHDTIVVFDRIRENSSAGTEGAPDSGQLASIINKSVNETLARSINTSLTLAFVLVALLYFGPSTLFYFTLTILIGTVIGTYSSIFVASPLIYVWQTRGQKLGKREVVDARN